MGGAVKCNEEKFGTVAETACADRTVGSVAWNMTRF